MGGLATAGPLTLLLLIGTIAQQAPSNLSVPDQILSGFNSFGSFVATGGFAIAPTFLAIFCVVWAAVSKLAVHLRRHDARLLGHIAVHAPLEAAAMAALAILFATIGGLASHGEAAFWEADSFLTLVTGVPLAVAASTAFGVWAIRKDITWHVTIVRPPLKNVLDFVDRKRDKDEFERM